MRIGVLHPGAMGVSVAESLRACGHEVCWVSAGRSAASTARAHNLTAYDDLTGLLADAQAVISVCPPGAALTQAQQVADTGFTGLYVDANAVAPPTAQCIAELFAAQYVDGGIVGPPAHRPGTTRLYLSGTAAGEVAAWFGELSPLQAIPLSGPNTAASALKMAYAAYTKGSGALLLAVNALAKASGVQEALYEEWSISQPDLMKRSQATAKGTAAKAWRFVDEMHEISATFAAQGLPGDIHTGAAQLYQLMAELKDRDDVGLEQVLEEILQTAALQKESAETQKP